MTAQTSPKAPPVISNAAESLRYGGRYELLDLVGAGGAGTVYRALDTELDEIVALKVLRKELIRSPLVNERFRSEVKLARRVTHRNVARMFDIGEHEGERFLTMEFVEGEILSRRIGRAMALPILFDITQQICAGLTAAHAVGIIHRDLKPDNVILGVDGRVVIMDFGIARALQPTESATPATGEFVGTPEYMSPEQAEGAAIDFRTDIYSLGVMLFELLTGGLPFTGSTPLIAAAARLLKPPPDPRTRRPNLPEPVAQLVLRCLARKPQDRYVSAQELADAFNTALLSSTGSGNTSGVFPAALIPQPGVGPVTIGESITLPGEARPSISSGGPLTIDAPETTKSIAVLPFRNNGPPEDDYLAAGLTDDLIDALSMVPKLRVRSRSTASSPDSSDAQSVGRALGAHVVVDGSVRRQGELLRVSTRLIQVEDGVQIWAQRFDRSASDALQVSDEVALAVASALTIGVSGPPRAVLNDGHAVDLYLRARSLFQSSDRVSMNEAGKLLEEALTLRPDDPMLLPFYAQVCARRWFFGGEGLGEQAQAAAERAVAVAGERAESRLALASVRFHLTDTVGAVRELLVAIKKSPTLADAHDLLGRILIETGPAARGVRHLERALELEPRLLRTMIDRARVQALIGDWDAADRLLNLALAPGSVPVGAWIMRSRFLLWKRNREAAERYLQHPDILSGRSPPAMRIMELIAGRHSQMDLERLFAGGLNANDSSPRGRAFYHQMTAELRCFFEDYPAALRSLARAVDSGFCDLGWFDRCPILDPLRSDPRFMSLRKLVAVRAAEVHEALRG